jgi:alpha-L-rhamnosidase
MKTILPLLFFLLVWLNTTGQNAGIEPSLLRGTWPSFWITCPDIDQRAYGVYHFRKSFELPVKPARFIVHVSADNRYRLFVNGTAVGSGPARGDLYNWYFESLDIAPHLKEGRNLIAALVWNMAEHAPVAQITNQTAFVLQGNTAAEAVVNTGTGWKVRHNRAYTPCSTDNGQRLQTYMVIGPGDRVDAAGHPWGWEQEGYDDSDWKEAQAIANAVPVGYGSDNLWSLTPRTIPGMEERMQRIPQVRRMEGMPMSGNGFLQGGAPLVVPPQSRVSVLLDQGFNTTAYPELLVGGGAGSEIRITYAEALFDSQGQKGNRNDIEGREIRGNYDIFLPDGGEQRLFRPLWFRTYRFMQLDIRTGDRALRIHDLNGRFTAYPFVELGRFESDDASHDDIWKVGWRTARLCAGETYFDCPYYEQLQYEGDTRIQSLISLYVTGDDRLMRKAIHDFYLSRVPEGLTQGRYPSSRIQVIPPFSLWWVSMVHDYWMHRSDDAFVRRYLTAIEGVMNWYEDHIDIGAQMLGPMKWWNFVDWNLAFSGGVPEGANDGNSSIISLQYAYTLRQAAELMAHFGRPAAAERYRKNADLLVSGTYRHCWDPDRGTMADTPQKKAYSQHAGIMAILTDALPEAERVRAVEGLLHDTRLSQATFYFRFYLTRALIRCGMADLYTEQLGPWRDMLAMGLTTFAENPEPTRSDCHAWSSSPNYDFLATVCGILPASPGFGTVAIRPALGSLKWVKGSMPHPLGTIEVALERHGEHGIVADITLPEGLGGSFYWKGEIRTLHPGKQQVSLP